MRRPTKALEFLRLVLRDKRTVPQQKVREGPKPIE